MNEDIDNIPMKKGRCGWCENIKLIYAKDLTDPHYDVSEEEPARDWCCDCYEEEIGEID